MKKSKTSSLELAQGVSPGRNWCLIADLRRCSILRGLICNSSLRDKGLRDRYDRSRGVCDHSRCYRGDGSDRRGLDDCVALVLLVPGPNLGQNHQECNKTNNACYNTHDELSAGS